jgi:hypothetical protein
LFGISLARSVPSGAENYQPPPPPPPPPPPEKPPPPLPEDDPGGVTELVTAEFSPDERLLVLAVILELLQLPLYQPGW